MSQTTNGDEDMNFSQHLIDSLMCCEMATFVGNVTAK